MYIHDKYYLIFSKEIFCKWNISYKLFIISESKFTVYNITGSVHDVYTQVYDIELYHTIFHKNAWNFFLPSREFNKCQARKKSGIRVNHELPTDI